MLMFKKTKIRIGFPFCVTALMLLSGELRESFICAFIISLFHETGHLIAMIVMKIYPDSISFTPTGIRINCTSEVVSPKAECIISASGPFVNVILMPILYFIPYKLPFLINTGLLMINLLPLRNLDAGRLLNNLIIIFKDELHAEKVMNVSETIVCILIISVLIISLIKGIINPSFIVFAVIIVITTVTQLVK